MIPHQHPSDRERQRGRRRQRGAYRAGRSAQGAPGSGDNRAPLGGQADDSHTWAGELQPVPIVEVGTRVRAHDGQRGIVLDVQDADGPLTYLVQLDGQTTGQFMPAYTLKGAQI